MSAPHERPTLAPSLYAYAKGLRDSGPDGPSPRRGHPLPDTARPPGRRGLRHHEARAAVTDILLPLLDAPDPARAAAEAERALAATGVVREQTVFHAAAAVEPPKNPRPAPVPGRSPDTSSGPERPSPAYPPDSGS